MAQCCQNEAWKWGRMRAGMGLELGKVRQKGRETKTEYQKALDKAAAKVGGLVEKKCRREVSWASFCCCD